MPTAPPPEDRLESARTVNEREPSLEASGPPEETRPKDRVPIAQRIGYGLGSFHDMWGHWLYPGMAYQVFNIYLGMSPARVATALFLNRFFDAVSDPLF